MKTIEENLTQYAAYHRDRRNIATHFVGVPLIVFSIVLALATLSVSVGPVSVTGAAIVCFAACLYYLRLDVVLGVTMAVILFLLCAAASEITARLATGATLGLALAIFAFGWALQFLGHKCEGMKPAFFDDVMQLIIGPLFVLAEVFFLLGAKPQLRRYVEERVGPVVARRQARTETGVRPPFPGSSSAKGNGGLTPVSVPASGFWDFYPFYLSEHRNPTCRKLHFAGSTLVLALLAAGLVTGKWWFFALMPLAGYGFAWVGHFAFEKNRPATFKNPGYSFAGDWVMYWQLLTGKIPFEERDPGTRQGADRA
jgi:uncharacterized membrane protein YGL010W